MRVCCIIDYFWPHYRGGGQLRLYELSRRLVQRGHHVTVVCMRQNDVPHHETLAGIEVVRIGPTIARPPRRSPLQLVHFLVALRTWLRRNDYDVVCAEGLSLLAAPLTQATPVLATIHDLTSEDGDQWARLPRFSRAVETWLVRRPYARIVTVTRAVQQQLSARGVAKARILVIPNAVDATRLNGISRRDVAPRTVVFVGRLIRSKHVDHAIIAMRSVLKTHPDARLIAFGKGPEEHRLRALAQGLPVTLVTNAHDEEVLGTMLGASALVLPSTREGFGIVLAEAALCRIPVVAYNIPALREVVQHGVTGLLVPPQPTQLADALTLLLSDPAKARAMGAAAADHILNTYDWDRSTEQWETLLAERTTDTRQNDLSS